MKSKHTYKSVDVEAVELVALVAAVVAACVEPGAVNPAVCVVALDVAKEKFFAALSTARGQVVQIVRFVHPKQSRVFLKLLMELKSNNLNLQVVLEPTGTYGDAIKHQCRERGLAVYEVSPKRTHDMAEVVDGVPSMHDAKATVTLAQLHAIGKSRKWEPASEQKRAFRALVDRRLLFSEPLQRNWGRLEALLARYWPESQELADPHNRSWLTLLATYAGPEAVAKAGEDAARVLKSAAKGRLTEDRIEQVVQAARETLGVPMQSGERELLCELVREIQRLRAKTDELDEQLASHAEADPVMKVMSKAVGPAAASALIAYVGAPQEYSSAHAYEKASGLNLKVRSSGKHEGQLKITKRGPSQVRRLLYLAALRHCQFDNTTRAWYQKRIGCGAGAKKSKMKAVVAVMRKLVRALWCIGHDPANPKAFDSTKLFDTSRLSLPQDVPTAATAQRPTPREASQHDRKRTARVRPATQSSAAEAHP
jgi:transposase